MTTKFNLNTYSNIYNVMKANIESRTGINNWNSDSVIRSIVEPIGAELARVNSDVQSVLSSMSLREAKSLDLDNLGANRGVDRLNATRSRAKKEDNNFYFYMTSGTFGDLNNGNPINVPSGTLITAAGANENVLVYRVSENIILNPGDVIAYCSIECVSIGALGNCSARTLTKHKITPSPVLKCSNRLPISNGRDIESDENYRYRILNKYASRYEITQEALNLKGIEIEGIFGQKFAKNWFGFGRSAVFLFGGNKEISLSTVEAYQKMLNSKLGVYGDIIAMPGIRVSLDLDLTVWINKSVTSDAETDYMNKIYAAASNYIISQLDESRVSLLGLINSIVSNVKEIEGISNKSDRSKIINAAYIRRNYGGGLSNGSERLKLVSTEYELQANEFVSLGSINISFERS